MLAGWLLLLGCWEMSESFEGILGSNRTHPRYTCVPHYLEHP
jgi:hypothetical protein